ncbi:FecCD family ABC transporter permease [Paenibacillus rhizophilus]|uniref:Iron ABC transporter permease n=1 Tax=Paenibacillus rhizophilus TaxID=1850366 RepID=A0A3N9PDT6_9BACL|nr:iron ABC transporter permease [Paenibacillus rhizophilus]RQW13720.1 iron ABC transporter permease [Paenibacillus rhizophilus]
MIQSELVARQRRILIALVLLLIATIFAGMGIGTASVSYGRIFPTLLGHGSFKDEFVLFSIRLPRMLVTLLSGMALALSGSILQAVTRNDLADPGIIGINSGAGVAVAVFFLHFPIDAGSFAYLLPLVGFAGGFLAAALIYILSYSRSEGLQPIKLVLTGIGCSMALSGLMIFIISSSDRQKYEFIAKWLAGNIWGTDWPFISALAPWLVILIPYVLYKSGVLNLLALSDHVAVGIGVRLQRERLGLLLAAVALASAAVSVTGAIAFIGLMTPHIAKSMVGPRHQMYIPVSLLLGGWLLMVADVIGHNIVGPEGVPAGIMVALIGAPYFAYLLLKK